MLDLRHVDEEPHIEGVVAHGCVERRENVASVVGPVPSQDHAFSRPPEERAKHNGGIERGPVHSFRPCPDKLWPRLARLSLRQDDVEYGDTRGRLVAAKRLFDRVELVTKAEADEIPAADRGLQHACRDGSAKLLIADVLNGTWPTAAVAGNA
jgi:hypothetical protein